MSVHGSASGSTTGEKRAFSSSEYNAIMKQAMKHNPAPNNAPGQNANQMSWNPPNLPAQQPNRSAPGYYEPNPNMWRPTFPTSHPKIPYATMPLGYPPYQASISAEKPPVIVDKPVTKPQQSIDATKQASCAESKEPIPPTLKPSEPASKPAVAHSASKEDEAAKPSQTAGNKGIRIGGEEVELFDDHIFAAIRKVDGISELNVDLSNFSFQGFAEGGGKGGSKMKFTNDKKLLVKELLSEDLKGLNSMIEQYAKHILGHPESLLTRYYYRFKRPTTGQEFVVMNSWMPNGKLTDKYDLKGTADDKMLLKDGVDVPQVHKRFYMAHWIISEAICNSAGVPTARNQYYAGKKLAFSHQIRLKPDDRRKIVKTIEDDVRFLQKIGVMDYSLLVGTIKATADATGIEPKFPPGAKSGHPFVVKEGAQYIAHYFGIIDYFQMWTAPKKAAHVVKLLFAPKPISTVDPAAYGDQFLKANERRFP